jgi:transposase
VARSAGSARKQKQGRNVQRVRARRDFDALRQRRMQAADMFGRGKRQVDVAAKLGVSQPTASRWYQMWLTGGRAGLVGAGRAGRRPKLSDEQLAQVEAALVKGPKANGYPTEMWTLARVAEVIERVTGVRHGTTQTWAILRERLGWSVQRPARRAKERNDEAIATWVKEQWPRIKTARGAAAPGSSSKTNRASRSSRR